MHAAARDYFTTYSHPRYFILLLSTSVQFYIITPLYVQCIFQLCVVLLLSMLCVDCTRDKSELTSVKTYIISSYERNIFCISVMSKHNFCIKSSCHFIFPVSDVCKAYLHPRIQKGLHDVLPDATREATGIHISQLRTGK